MAVLVTGCGSASSTGSDPSALLTEAAPSGYAANTAASGALDLAAASAATPVPANELAGDLKDAGYVNAYSRVWTRGSDFVSDIAVQLADPGKAESFVAAQRNRLLDGVGTQVVSDPDIPDAALFLLVGSVTLQHESVFCQGIAFPIGRFAVEVETCSLSPGSADLALAEARRQYEHGAHTIGITASPPSSSTG